MFVYERTKNSKSLLRAETYAMVEKAGFVPSAKFLIKHVLGLALSGDTVSQRARYL